MLTHAARRGRSRHRRAGARRSACAARSAARPARPTTITTRGSSASRLGRRRRVGRLRSAGADRPRRVRARASALPIWADFMKRTAAALPPREFAVPDGLQAEELCSVSYLQPVEECPTYTEYFKDGDDDPVGAVPDPQGHVQTARGASDCRAFPVARTENLPAFSAGTERSRIAAAHRCKSRALQRMAPQAARIRGPHAPQRRWRTSGLAATPSGGGLPIGADTWATARRHFRVWAPAARIGRGDPCRDRPVALGEGSRRLLQRRCRRAQPATAISSGLDGDERALSGSGVAISARRPARSVGSCRSAAVQLDATRAGRALRSRAR